MSAACFAVEFRDTTQFVGWVAAFLLLLSGIPKIVSPASFGTFLTQMIATPASTPTGKDERFRIWGIIVGIGESVVGVAMMLSDAAWVWAVGACLFAAFTVLLVFARMRGLDDCGCFGERSAAPSFLHIGVNCFFGVALTNNAYLGPHQLQVAPLSLFFITFVAGLCAVGIKELLIRLS